MLALHCVRGDTDFFVLGDSLGTALLCDPLLQLSLLWRLELAEENDHLGRLASILRVCLDSDKCALNVVDALGGVDRERKLEFLFALGEVARKGRKALFPARAIEQLDWSQ